MIAFLRGNLVLKKLTLCILDVGGVGYEIFITVSTYEKLPDLGEEVQLYISESMAMYGGGTTYFGFLSLQEKDIFSVFRQNVSGTGGKKALDYLDKASKSLPDFRRAILEGDSLVLMSLFGFRKKTAEKLVIALREPLLEMSFKGQAAKNVVEDDSLVGEIISGLLSLGYKESEARPAARRARDQIPGEPSAEELLRESLKHI